MGKKNSFNDLGSQLLDESEVITRMMKVLNEYQIYDLKTLNWEKTFEEIGIDSLD